MSRFLTEDTDTGEHAFVRLCRDPSGHIPVEYNPFRKEYWQDYDAKAETVFGAIRNWGPVGKALEVPARGLVGIGRFMAVDDIMTLADECATDGEKLLAGISLVPFGKIAKVKNVADATFDAGSAGKKVVQEAVDASQGRTYRHMLDLQMFADETDVVSRNGALNQAKRDAGIPRSQQPEAVNRVDMRSAQHEGGHVIKDSKGKVINTREYVYTNKDGKKIVIQDHGAGHEKGGQGPHFNVRPADNTRTGKVPGTMEHYPFNK